MAEYRLTSCINHSASGDQRAALSNSSGLAGLVPVVSRRRPRLTEQSK